MAATALFNLALDAIDHGLFEEVVARIEGALAGADRHDPRLHQVLGLARRGQSDGPEALAAFSQAAALAPTDPLIAHSHARSAWEAGLPAVQLYRQAMTLAPRNADMLIGHAAALVAEGQGDAAMRALQQTLDANPGWPDGHAAYARVVAAAGVAADGTATVRAALRGYPDDPVLWRTLLQLLRDARRHAEAIPIAAEAQRRFDGGNDWRRAEAVSLSELGDAIAAQRLFDTLPLPDRAGGLVAPIRNLIRLGRFDEASALAERQFAAPEEAALWPYRALLWRVAGDPRWSWLEGDERLIGTYDLGLSADQVGALAAVLRGLHARSAAFLDQSVRGGTQTDGPLFARAEPELRMLRDAILTATHAHVAQLPGPEPGHPTLIETRAPLRFAGSWSVRLASTGFHIDHVHPQGWLSSACYVALPRPAPGGHDGWLAFGECRDLLPGLDGFRLIEPKVGRLVLFPSTMWHGTRPFSAGERMSVAFDIARPPAG